MLYEIYYVKQMFFIGFNTLLPELYKSFGNILINTNFNE